MPVKFDKDVFLWNSLESDAMPAFRGGYITERKFESFRGTGRCLSNRLVQSGKRSMLRVANERRDRERETTVEQKVALALRCDDAKMSLVVRRERESLRSSCKKANAQHF